MTAFIRVLFLIFLHLLLTSANLLASDDHAFKRNNPDIMKYDFARSYISSFSYLEAMDKRLQEAEKAKKKSDQLGFIQWNLDRLAKDNMDIRIAKNYVSKYFNVPNSLMRKVIDTYAYSCDQLIELNANERALWNQLHQYRKQGELSGEQDKEFVEGNQKLSLQRKEFMRGILESSVLLTKVLISENVKEKAVKKRLALSANERDKLVRKLDTFAADNLDWGMKPGQTYLQGAVATVREVLEDPTYLSADE
jgi:hypothetical protein